MPAFDVYNPAVEDVDLVTVLMRIFALGAARFILAGAYHKGLRGWMPCILDVVIYRPEMNEMKRSKYYENIWYVMWHTSASIAAACLLALATWHAEILSNPSTARYENAFFIDWADHQMSFYEKDFYLWQFSFWSSSVLYLAIENRRSDFLQMCIHHAATCILIGFSYRWNYWRIGMLVVMLHDWCDIFLYAAKASKDTDCCSDSSTEILFVLFTVSFFVLRLVIYPYVCVWTAIRTGMHDIVDGLWVPGYGILSDFPVDAKMMKADVGLYSMPILLMVLFGLHCFWFILICRVIAKTLNKRDDLQDIRSDSDDEGTSPATASPRHSPRRSGASPYLKNKDASSHGSPQYSTNAANSSSSSSSKNCSGGEERRSARGGNWQGGGQADSVEGSIQNMLDAQMNVNASSIRPPRKDDPDLAGNSGLAEKKSKDSSGNDSSTSATPSCEGARKRKP